MKVQYRASLEQDLVALREHRPDLAIGTTPVVQAAKEQGLPALYFTNLISARPLMGPAGAGSLAQVVNAASPFIVSLNDDGQFPATFSSTPSPANDIAKVLLAPLHPIKTLEHILPAGNTNASSSIETNPRH